MMTLVPALAFADPAVTNDHLKLASELSVKILPDTGKVGLEGATNFFTVTKAADDTKYSMATGAKVSNADDVNAGFYVGSDTADTAAELSKTIDANKVIEVTEAQVEAAAYIADPTALEAYIDVNGKTVDNLVAAAEEYNGLSKGAKSIVDSKINSTWTGDNVTALKTVLANEAGAKAAKAADPASLTDDLLTAALKADTATLRSAIADDTTVLGYLDAAKATKTVLDAWDAYVADPTSDTKLVSYQAKDATNAGFLEILSNRTPAADAVAAKVVDAKNAAVAAVMLSDAGITDGTTEDPGTGDVSGVGNKVAKAASGVYVKTSNADADNSDVLEFEVDLYGTNGRAAADLDGANLYIWAERSNNVISDIDTITVTSTGADVATNPNVGSVKVTAVPNSGVVKFTVRSSQAGKVTVKASLDAAELNTEKNLLSANGSGVSGEFTALSTSANKVVFSVDGATSGTGKDNNNAYKGAKANSIDKYVVTATITTKDGQPVKDQKVTISANKSGIELEKEEVKTDNRGKVEFDVTATKSGTFVVTVAAGNASGDVYLNFSATTATNVEITKAPTTTVAVDSEVTFKVAAKDVYGNRFTSSNAFISGSTVAKLGDKEYNMSFDGTDSNGDHKFIFTPSKVGTYEVTFKLPNGKKATTTLEVAEQGKIVEMQVNYDANTVNLGATTNEPEVVQVDAAGVTKTTKSANIKYAINGKGVLNFNSNTGVIAVSTDDKYIGEVLTVTAVDKTNAVSAVATLTIAADAQSLSFNGTAGVTGQDANIPFSVVDANGNKVALGNNVTVNTTAVVTSKPEGANATAVVNKEGELKDKGVAILQVNSNKDGEVKVQVMIEAEYPLINGVAAHTEYYTGTATVTFGDKAVEGATSTATMIIGSTTFVANGKVVTSDVAPFVKDGRTFLPIRALGEALGAEVSFDEATNVVTIKLDGKTVTMTLGSAVMTVGDKVVTMDTAAYATAEGRTVVPVRFAAEALGFNVEAVYATDGTTSAVNFSK